MATKWRQRVPAGRIGTDEDMAGVAIYLASRAGDYVVGDTIAVDGGMVYANPGIRATAGIRGSRAGWVNRGETLDCGMTALVSPRAQPILHA